MVLAFRSKFLRGIAGEGDPESGATIRIHALYVQTTEMMPKDWLTQAVEQYLARRQGALDSPEDALPDFMHLTIGSRAADYVLAMKCRTASISTEFARAEMEEIRFLLRYLRLRTPSEVFSAIGQHYPPEQIPPAVQYVIENSLDGE